MAFLTGGLLDFLSKLMEKAEGGTYDRTTDSNEAISEAIAGPIGRGEFEVVTGNTTSSSGQTLIDLTGSGKLYWIQGQGDANPSICYCTITIDGYVFRDLTLSVNDTPAWAAWVLNPDSVSLDHYLGTDPTVVSPAAMLNIDYQDGLKIHFSSSNDTDTVYIRAAYSVD